MLAVLLFPLVGGGLLALGWRGWRQWRYYGPLPVQLDPAPGQLGGDIGGRIQLRVPWQREPGYRLVLQCLHITVSGSGKNRRRSETLVWQQEQVPWCEPDGDGTALQFVFSPPPTLPASEEADNDYRCWRLLLEGPRRPVALQRTYTLPVIRGSGRSGIRLPAAHVREQQARARVRALEDAGQQILLQQTADGVRLQSPFGLHLGMKLVLLLAGLVFAGAALFLTFRAIEEGGMLWFMALVFGLFGYPLTLGGLFMLGRSLETDIRPGQVQTLRRWLGLPLWRRRASLATADQLALMDGVKSHDGRRHTEYLHLVVKDGGRTVRLAEDVRGREAAEALRDSLVRLLGLP